jgi:phage terminase large subunit
MGNVVEIKTQIPEAMQFLLEPHRFKVAASGRGAGAKSWTFARTLLSLGTIVPLRILCARETMLSIKESVHRLLSNQIELLGMGKHYDILKSSIAGRNGSEFVFAGLRQLTVDNIKSFESIDIVWVEEAANVTKRSWDVLIPTIRKDDVDFGLYRGQSEIWVSFNPNLESDDTYQRFIVKPDARMAVHQLTTEDNPWFTQVLRDEMEACRINDPHGFAHIWQGQCQSITEATIYKDGLMAAETSGRICSVPYDPIKPVDVFFDIGISDFTAIWFVQTVGYEYHLIDYEEGNNRPLVGDNGWLMVLQSKPFNYGTHYLPHDARAREKGSGKTYEELLRASGRRVQIVRNLSESEQVNAGRAVFHRCYFDREGCKDGLRALRYFQWAPLPASAQAVGDASNPGKQTYSTHTLHNWASHGGKAFTYFAIGSKEPEPQMKQPSQPPSHTGRGSFMPFGRR